MRRRIKEEPMPGHKVEKRKKRRWDRAPEVVQMYRYGIDTIEIYWTVPHITFRSKEKKGTPSVQLEKKRLSNRRSDRSSSRSVRNFGKSPSRV